VALTEDQHLQILRFRIGAFQLHISVQGAENSRLQGVGIAKVRAEERSLSYDT
jgi:hypothetical protein